MHFSKSPLSQEINSFEPSVRQNDLKICMFVYFWVRISKKVIKIGNSVNLPNFQANSFKYSLPGWPENQVQIRIQLQK